MRHFTLLLPFIFLLLSGVEPALRSEEWGYVEVRPGAHMFWWYHKSPNRVHSPSAPWPVVLWLQGGPGASGIGYGSFGEIGPLDIELKPRNSTWLHVADLLFVDNPVGTGFSFVDDESLLAHTDEEVGSDLTVLLKELFNCNRALQRSPLYVVGESYGGRYAVTLGLSIVRAIIAGELKLRLGGIALGNSFISPVDYIFSYASLLKDMSRLDENGVLKVNRMAVLIKQQIEKGQYTKAMESRRQLMIMIEINTNGVDLFNLLRDSSESINADLDKNLPVLMNGSIRKKLKIIPQHVQWESLKEPVYVALAGDILKPRIKEVDELLAEGVNVTIYNGQLDVSCATKGTERWLQKLKWEGLKRFTSLDRIPLYCASKAGTKAFRKSYKNLHFYWILGAGHFVPVEQPCIALKMLQEITSSPVSIP